MLQIFRSEKMLAQIAELRFCAVPLCRRSSYYANVMPTTPCHTLSTMSYYIHHALVCHTMPIMPYYAVFLYAYYPIRCLILPNMSYYDSEMGTNHVLPKAQCNDGEQFLISCNAVQLLQQAF